MTLLASLVDLLAVIRGEDDDGPRSGRRPAERLDETREDPVLAEDRGAVAGEGLLADVLARLPVAVLGAVGEVRVREVDDREVG